MAICRICGKNTGFFGAIEISLNNKNSKMYPASISLCNSCGDLMEYMSNGDEESFNKIHQITDNKDDDLLKEFIKTWDDKYNKNKKAGDVRRKSKQIEDAWKNNKLYELDDIKITTGLSFEGYNIKKYLGICSGEAVLGTGFISEFSADFSDFFGVESNEFAEKIDKAMAYAIRKLIIKALDNEANAIIGVNFSYPTFSRNMVGVIATGTLVQIEKDE